MTFAPIEDLMKLVIYGRDKVNVQANGKIGWITGAQNPVEPVDFATWPLIELLDYDYKAINIFFFIFMIFQIEFSFMGTQVNEFEKNVF